MERVTDACFAEEVLESELPVIVHFTAPWCRPCRHLEPVLREFADGLGGRARLVSLDVDENVGAPSRYGVLTVPTVILFSAGEPQARVLGLRPSRHYAEAFAAVLG